MTTSKNISSIDLIWAWVNPAVDCWFKDQCRNPYTKFYVYYKPSKPGMNGAIAIAEQPLNEEWVLGDNVHISPAKTTQVIKRELADKARSWPILGY